jgi:hypothetical protein
MERNENNPVAVVCPVAYGSLGLMYPDELVAEILTASTYPIQIVEADRWLQENSSLRGAQLADEVESNGEGYREDPPQHKSWCICDSYSEQPVETN